MNSNRRHRILRVAASSNTLHSKGIEFHTLIPTRNGTEIVLFDEGSGLRRTVNNLGADYNVKVKQHKGTGGLIGSWDSREEGKQEYERRISEYRGLHDLGWFDGLPVRRGTAAQKTDFRWLLKLERAIKLHTRLRPQIQPES